MLVSLVGFLIWNFVITWVKVQYRLCCPQVDVDPRVNINPLCNINNISFLLMYLYICDPTFADANVTPHLYMPLHIYKCTDRHIYKSCTSLIFGTNGIPYFPSVTIEKKAAILCSGCFPAFTQIVARNKNHESGEDLNSCYQEYKGQW